MNTFFYESEKKIITLENNTRLYEVDTALIMIFVQYELVFFMLFLHVAALVWLPARITSTILQSDREN